MDRERRLRWALLIGVSLFLAELATAFLSGSLALLADSGHLFLDVFALALAYVGSKVAARQPDQRYTYGYHRAEVLAAAFNAALLFLLVGFVVHEASARFFLPASLRVVPMLTMAVVGLGGNILMGIFLSRHEKEDLNMRAAFLHVLGDALGSLAVLGAGIVLVFSGPTWVDPAASLLIALFISVGAVRVLRGALRILAEAAPDELSVTEIARALAAVPGVQDVHDLHIWSLKPGFPALTAHVVLGKLSLGDADRVAEEIRMRLRERFGVEHVTLQVEGQSCTGPCCNGQFMR